MYIQKKYHNEQQHDIKKISLKNLSIVYFYFLLYHKRELEAHQGQIESSSQALKNKIVPSFMKELLMHQIQHE